MTDDIEVSVWSHIGSGDYGIVGGATYESLSIEPRYADLGVWALTLPQGAQSRAITPGRLVTTTFRSQMLTWTVAPRATAQSDDGDLTVTLGGFDALSILGWATAWPAPALAIGSQPAQGSYSGPAETVIRSLVTENLGTRYGLAFDAPTSQGRGATVRSKPRFDNLLTEVLRLAKRGGIGVRFGLVPTTSNTRARLTLTFYVPRDLSGSRIRFSAADGSLASWELTENAPTMTKAIVGGAGTGAGQYLRVVTTTQSNADATTWGGHREAFVDGPETADNTTLDDAGADALAEGAASTTLTMEAQEPRGTKAFTSFDVGDKGLAVPYPGVNVVDTITSIKVVHDTAGDPLVSPIFGDPEADDDPDSLLVQAIRSVARDVANAKINRKRGTV